MPSRRAKDRHFVNPTVLLSQLATAAPAIVVRFLNPTLNKALHVGHLRNACLGSAAAACLSHLGVRVIRHCLLEDVGPHMALALYGLQKASGRRKPIVAGTEKPDHQAHAYYLHGRALCTPRHQHKQRRAPAAVEIARAVVPEEILRDWARGRPQTLADAAQIKALALHGQSVTLNSFNIDFDCCDFKSAETPYVAGFLDHGLAQQVFRRLRDESIVYGASDAKVVLKYAPCALHEFAHLLCFMYRSLMWQRPDWLHFAFAGQEWAPVMSQYPALLAELGAVDAMRNYVMVFHGMVTSTGKKVASQSGLTMLADDLLVRLQNLGAVADLARNAKGLMTAREIACLLARIWMLEAAREHNFDFSFRHVAARKDAAAWQIAEAITAVCAKARRSWIDVAPLPNTDARYREATERCRLAVDRVSFEGIVAALHKIANRIARQVAAGDVTEGDIGELAMHLKMLGLGGRATGMRLDGLPSLFSEGASRYCTDDGRMTAARRKIPAEVVV